MITATEDEIKKYNLSKNDAEQFLNLINISSSDYEVVYMKTNSGNYEVCVKFPEKSAQEIELIMRVAVDQLQARIKRSKEWSNFKK